MQSKMKGIDSTGAPLVHVPGWMDEWVDGSKSRFKDCLQQSKINVGAFGAETKIIIKFLKLLNELF
jgi:hypothetical protein